MFGTSVTFEGLIDDVVNRLQGFGVNNDQFTTLESDLSPTDLTVKVTDPGRISQGIIEVGTELMQVNSASDTTATIPPWGRGAKGTIAEAHTAGERVAMRPTYPRAVVGRLINETLSAVYPVLYAVKQTEITANGVQWQFALPADCQRVLRVEESQPGNLGGWNIVEDWDVVHGANATDFPSGVVLSLKRTTFGTVRVWYSAAPVKFSALADDWSVTGLPFSCMDVIVLGTAVKLLPWLDTGRLPVESVEADALDNARQLGTAVSAAKSLKSDYADALAREASVLATMYPIRARGVR